jgi:phage N-6-adenine-methyltransferase
MIDSRATSSRSVHFRSDSEEWATPAWLFDELNRRFGFTLDVCATPSNAKCRRFFTREQDGLAQEWTGVCWMNPPYGRPIAKWIRKARLSALAGATVVALVPARPDTRWWQEDVAAASEIIFLKGRLKFGTASNSAPFPSAIVVFRPPSPSGNKSAAKRPAASLPTRDAP